MAMVQCGSQCFERPVSGFWQRFGQLLEQLGKKIERWDQLARQRQELQGMDDRMLKDIGLSRSDVARIAGRRWFWNDPLQKGERLDDRYRSSGKW